MTVPADKPKKIGPKKIAIVVHQEQSRPGRVGALLEKRGYELHRLCPNLGCDLPEDMSDYAGVVIFGGPMSANDCGTLAGIKCELDWIPKVVEAGVPFLGLCLGAQLLTRAAGGRVASHPEGLVEIGYVDVEPTAAGRDWFKAPMKVYQWHREGMTHSRLLRAAGDQRTLSRAGLSPRQERVRLPVPSRGHAGDEARSGRSRRPSD